MTLTELIKHMKDDHGAPLFVLGLESDVLREVHALDHEERESRTADNMPPLTHEHARQSPRGRQDTRGL
jgi:hypothetical protein